MEKVVIVASKSPGVNVKFRTAGVVVIEVNDSIARSPGSPGALFRVKLPGSNVRSTKVSAASVMVIDCASRSVSLSAGIALMVAVWPKAAVAVTRPVTMISSSLLNLAWWKYKWVFFIMLNP